MGLQELERLLQDLLAAIQDVLQSGEELSDEFQGELAQTLQLLFERIEGLRQQEGPTEGLHPTPQEPLTPGMPSSNVNAFGYDDKTGNLLVQFLGQHPNREGPIYSYGGVPKVIFELFQAGAVPARTNGKNAWGAWWKGKQPSLGASLYTLIKERGYPYQRLA